VLAGVIFNTAPNFGAAGKPQHRASVQQGARVLAGCNFGAVVAAPNLGAVSAEARVVLNPDAFINESAHRQLSVEETVSAAIEKKNAVIEKLTGS
jgi:hypothetical protein